MDDVELKSTLMAKKGGRRESVSAEQVGGDVVSTVGADCTLALRENFCARSSPFLMSQSCSTTVVWQLYPQHTPV